MACTVTEFLAKLDSSTHIPGSDICDVLRAIIESVPVDEREKVFGPKAKAPVPAEVEPTPVE